jgi:hypothetical protein
MAPLGFFLIALLLWEVMALAVQSGSLGAFLKSISDPLSGMAAFFYGLYALPIVLFVAVADAVSHRLAGRAQPIIFAGLCCVGFLALIGFFMKSATDWTQLQRNGFVQFIGYPTLCVFALYLGRSVLQQPTR